MTASVNSSTEQPLSIIVYPDIVTEPMTLTDILVEATRPISMLENDYPRSSTPLEPEPKRAALGDGGGHLGQSLWFDKFRDAYKEMKPRQ